MDNSNIDMNVLSKQMKLQQAIELIRSVGGRSSLSIDSDLTKAMAILVEAQKDCMLEWSTPYN